MSALNQVLAVLQRWPLIQAGHPDWELALAIVPSAVRNDLGAYELVGGGTPDTSQYTGCELLGVRVVFNPILPRDEMQLIVKPRFHGLVRRIGIDVQLSSTIELRRYQIEP